MTVKRKKENIRSRANEEFGPEEWEGKNKWRNGYESNHEKSTEHDMGNGSRIEEGKDRIRSGSKKRGLNCSSMGRGTPILLCASAKLNRVDN